MLKHIDELRARLINSLIFLSLVFIGCYYFSSSLYDLIALPILKYLPAETKIITTKVTAPFMVPLQFSFLLALLISAPYLLYNIWMFVKPGLYKHERQNFLPIIIASCILFYAGIGFAIFVICPIALKFFISCAPASVTVMLDIANYLDFIVTIAIGTGIGFQIPIVTSLLIRCKIFTKQQLRHKRRHVIVVAFVAGMLLAPPDVISQILLALPMWVLFEAGLAMS